MMVGYRVIENSNYANLENRVELLAEDGWRPAGGIETRASDNGPVYFQAMTKSKEYTWRGSLEFVAVCLIAGFLFCGGMKSADWLIPDPPKEMTLQLD